MISDYKFLAASCWRWSINNSHSCQPQTQDHNTFHSHPPPPPRLLLSELQACLAVFKQNDCKSESDNTKTFERFYVAEQIIREDFRSMFLDMAAVDLNKKQMLCQRRQNFIAVAHICTLLALLRLYTECGAFVITVVTILKLIFFPPCCVMKQLWECGFQHLAQPDLCKHGEVHANDPGRSLVHWCWNYNSIWSKS